MSNLKTKVQVLIIVVLTFLAYSNIFQNGFVVDDDDFFINWKEKQSLGNIQLMFEGNNPPGYRGIYRPLRGVLYTLYHQVWGTNPFGYHLHGILVHLVSTILVYFIARCLTSEVKKMQLHLRGGEYLAFITALLFGLHPIHTESITFMTSSMDMTGPMFMFASFYLYLKAQPTSKVKEIGLHLRGVLLGGSIVFAALAYSSYEPTLVLPLLLVGYELIVQSSKFKVQNYSSKFKIFNFKPIFLTLIPYFVFALIFALIRVEVIGRSPTHYKYLTDSFYHTMLMMSKVFVKYLTLMTWPLNISINHIIDPNFETFNPPVNSAKVFLNQSIFDTWVLISLATIILLFLSLGFFIKTNRKLLSFGIIWIILGLLPFANLVPQPTPLAERYLYLASFGFTLVISYWLLVIGNLLKTRNINFITSIIIIIIILSYAYLTYQRNKDWKDTATLWSKTIQAYPQNAFSYYVLANQASRDNRIDDAARLYLKTIALKPHYIAAYLNLGNMYFKGKKYDLAESILVQATRVEVEPLDWNRLDASVGDLSKVYNVLGLIYIEQGRHKEAYASFLQAVSLNPSYTGAKKSLDDLVKNNSEVAAFEESLNPKSWQKYIFAKGFTFSYPKNWTRKVEAEKVFLTSPDNKFHIELELEEKVSSYEQYLVSQDQKYGVLIKNRFTRLPNFDKAYARVWDNNGVSRIEFFIFHPKKTIKMLIYPSGPELKLIFENLIRSIKID